MSNANAASAAANKSRKIVPAAVGQSLTTTSVEKDHDWVRMPKQKQLFCGFSRAHLYQLCTRGLIRSISVRQPHNQRGIRLIYRPSIHAYIEKLDSEQNGAATAAAA